MWFYIQFRNSFLCLWQSVQLGHAVNGIAHLSHTSVSWTSKTSKMPQRVSGQLWHFTVLYICCYSWNSLSKFDVKSTGYLISKYFLLIFYTLWKLYILACQASVTIGKSGLWCCVLVTSFEHFLTTFFFSFFLFWLYCWFLCWCLLLTGEIFEKATSCKYMTAIDSMITSRSHNCTFEL